MTAGYEAAFVDLDGTVYRGDGLVRGADAGVRALRAAGVEATRDAPGDLLVASMDRSFTYEKLDIALRTLGADTPFLATNPDRTCPTESGAIPDAAGMIAAVEGVTGRELDAVLGKPSATMAETALGDIRDVLGA